MFHLLTDTFEDVLKQVEENALHTPVMLNEIAGFFDLQNDEVFVDLTLGLGGHALEITKNLGPHGLLVGIDRDKEALKIINDKLKGKPFRHELVHDDFRNIDTILNRLEVSEVDGILLDAGISSFQLNDPQRGFSFLNDGPLDMRMDQNGHITAYDLINSLSERELSTILRDYGEERWHRRIAHFIAEQRQKKPISTTKEFSDCIIRAIPSRYRRQKIHGATRSFQAIRIAVNRELESLEMAIDKGIQHLKVGGKFCVISFHSLEDRIVKHKFRHLAKYEEVDILTKKPLRPSEEEERSNPRARSAKLRVVEKI